ncbi:MAG: glycosyltransferase family 2 protein [Pseudomonadota bacterium]
MVRLSAVIITRNEEREIADCLDSLAFCDERIVLDCGSADRTVALARSHGALVYHLDWQGFGRQKDAALSLATGEWVLSIDADERATRDLADAISAAIHDTNHAAFRMPRLATFLGQEIRTSGWWPDHVVRLVRRGAGRFNHAAIHEQIEVNGTIGAIDTPLLHHAVRDLDQVTQKIDRYSRLGADHMAASGREVGFFSGPLHALGAFMRMYVLKRGFMDGRNGFLIAMIAAHNTFYRYMKVWTERRRDG